MKQTLVTTLAVLATATAGFASNGWDYQTGFGDVQSKRTVTGSSSKVTIIVANNGPQPGPRYQIILQVTRPDGTQVCAAGYPYLDGLGVNKHSEPLAFQVTFERPLKGRGESMAAKFVLSADVKPYGADPSGDTNLQNNYNTKTITFTGNGHVTTACKKLMGE
jgi:hypothetical protein